MDPCLVRNGAIQIVMVSVEPGEIESQSEFSRGERFFTEGGF